ncbi:hypothetical protein [Micromonospora zamorensis]|uniref:hypothetical protein n=1 Tax=Micromonospora zamorensis TaxID=709883 RepID=UPI003CF54918
MAARELKAGEYVYLVPTLPTAPSAAYRRPLCEVVTTYGERVRVALGDGTEIETDTRNVVRTLPDLTPRDPRPCPRRSLPDGFEEVPLW